MVILGIALIASIATTFYRYIILEDISYETDEDVFQESLLEE